MSVGLRKRLDELISTKICAVVEVEADSLLASPFYIGNILDKRRIWLKLLILML